MGRYTTIKRSYFSSYSSISVIYTILDLMINNKRMYLFISLLSPERNLAAPLWAL